MKIIAEVSSLLWNIRHPDPVESLPTAALPETIAAASGVLTLATATTKSVARIPVKGDRGSDVVLLQNQINEVGAVLGIKIKVDGIFMKETAGALSKIQKRAGLPGSGVIGPKTMALLNLEVAKPATSPIGKWRPKHFKIRSRRVYIEKLVNLVVDELLKTDPVNFRMAVETRNGNLVKSMACGAFVSMRVRERTNRNDGEVVEMIQKVSHGSKGDAWCMFMQQAGTMIAECLCDLVSPMYSSGSCASVREKSPKEIEVALANAIRGDTVVFKYLTGSRKGLGHTGDLEKHISPGKTAWLNEGNTTEGRLGEEVVREGGGAYLTSRIMNTSSMRTEEVLRTFPESA